MSSKIEATEQSKFVIKATEVLRHLTDFGGGGGFTRPQPKKAATNTPK